MTQASRPNILLITCDQYRFPRFSYGPEAGFHEPLKRILGFQREDDAHNPYAAFFPGLLALRENAALLRNHTIAASACTPSRAAIYTGQYGTRTGVTQTDGLFKSGDSWNFPWLAADGVPTLGTWMREAGYTTHYFGKWHVSNPPEHSLDRYGFDDWEESYPEPHGAAINNLGVYRDAGFTDQACAFIRRKALALDYNRVQAVEQAQDPYAAGPDTDKIPPWFAVASFTNPHDIATYPAVIAQALPTPDNSGAQSIFGPLTVPTIGQKTPPPTAGTIQIALNALGFPQDCAAPSPTQNEDLSSKPSCQHDYAYKVGLAPERQDRLQHHQHRRDQAARPGPDAAGYPRTGPARGGPAGAEGHDPVPAERRARALRPGVPAAVRLAPRGRRHPRGGGAQDAGGDRPGAEHHRRLPGRPRRVRGGARHDDREVAHGLSGGPARAGDRALPAVDGDRRG
jgi:hypothetical protein